MGTSTTLDAIVMVLVLSTAVAGYLVVHLARELAPVRPPLPAADCPPAGASRLVPAGQQLDLEARRGVLALEAWLAAHRRHS